MIVSLPCHLSVLTKFAHVELRLSGRLRRRIVIVYKPVNPRDRGACSGSVAVGLTLTKKLPQPESVQEPTAPYAPASSHYRAYSTDVCHPVHGKVATQSTGSLPPNPHDSCHPVHVKAATWITGSLPPRSAATLGRPLLFWLFLPNPRQCKISRAWGRLTGRNAVYMQGSHVGVRYTRTGRQDQSRKPVNIKSITLFSDRS